MKSDSQLQTEIMNELKKDKNLKHERICISVLDGVVTLHGTVPTYFEKRCAESIIERIHDVKAIVENIEVKLVGPMFSDDEDIAIAILEKFKFNDLIDDGNIKISISEGWVTLKGTAEWEFQRKVVENIARETQGVKYVSNLIKITPELTKENLKENIEKSLSQPSNKIGVVVKQDKVILTGQVRSIDEMKLVEDIAWGCPGIKDVQDLMKISTI